MPTKEIITTTVPTAIPIEDLTQVILDGTGVFDKFLTLHRLHLTREFEEARIQGKEYSEVYTKTYIAHLEQAIQFLLAKEKQAYELNLLEAQIDKMQADAANAKKQLEILQWELTNKLPMELALVTAQVDKMKADTDLAKEQLKLAEKELVLKDKELTLKDKEIAIAEKQLKLAQQKVITETAQTDPSVVKPGSVIDMNNKALQSQIDGVKRDSEQKALQLIIQTWVTRMNNDAAYINDANMLTDKYIGRAVAKVFEGVNISTAGKNEAAETTNNLPQ